VKICFVTTNFPRYLGDSEANFIWEAARAVAQWGHQVRVIAQHWPGSPTYEWLGEIEVIRPRYWWPESQELLRREGGGLPIVWRKSRLARLQMLPFLLVHTLAVARYARGCDVIHAQWTLSAGAAWLSRVSHGCPIVVTLHGSDIFQAAQGRLGARLTRRVLQGCDRIIAVSQALAEAAGQIGISPGSITVIPDGVDLSQFSPAQSEREPLLLYIGSLIKRKGVEYLIEALAAIAQRQPSLRLLIVGDGPERPTLERLVSDRCLTERVTFAGQQPSNQVRLWLQQAKLFVLPSVEEGLGVVLLEALACGVPIVASRVGGIPEAVTPEVGLLVPPANPTLLGEAIIQLLSDEPRWQMMSQNARKRAEEFYDWRQIAAKLITIYRDLSCN
jgi:glycosyltransferase involved in cell wall biosynthesis